MGCSFLAHPESTENLFFGQTATNVLNQTPQAQKSVIA